MLQVWIQRYRLHSKLIEYKKKTDKFSSKCIVHIQHYMLRIKYFRMLRNLTQNIMYHGRKTALQNNHFKHKMDDSQPTSTYIYIPAKNKTSYLCYTK